MREYLDFMNFETEQEEMEYLQEKKKVNKSLYKIYNEDCLEETYEDFDMDEERLGY